MSKKPPKKGKGKFVTPPPPPRPSRNEVLEARFRRLRAMAGEHFPNFIVIASAGPHDLRWSTNDQTWAIGAMQRVGQHFRRRNELSAEAAWWGPDEPTGDPEE